MRVSIRDTFESSPKQHDSWTHVVFTRHCDDGRFEIDPGFGGYPTMYGAIAALDPFQEVTDWPACDVGNYIGRMGA